MKDTFTKTMSWLHTWGGLVFGWFLFAIFLTGTLSVFDKEITRWMQPELPAAGTEVSPQALVAITRFLAENARGAEKWSVTLPTDRSPNVGAWWSEGDDFHSRTFDNTTGAPIDARATMGGHFFVHFHFSFNWWPVGAYIVAAIAVGTLLMLVSGIVIHKRIFKDFFTFRLEASAQRSWLDAHNVTGVLALPFHLMIVYTGIVVFHTTYVPAGIQAVYGGDDDRYFAEYFPEHKRPAAGQAAPIPDFAAFLKQGEAVWGKGRVASLTVAHPGDRAATVAVAPKIDDQLALRSDQVVFDAQSGAEIFRSPPSEGAATTWAVMTGLHFAHFGGAGVRWIYFMLGLAGSVMIATGLMLFEVKRARKHEADQRSVRLAKRLNCAALVGPIVASLVFLWANRLLPPDFDGREHWEVNAFFAVLGLSVLHAAVRASAWREQLALVASLALLLPVLNALTTSTGLLSTIVAGDWARASVDMVAFTAGAVSLWLVRQIGPVSASRLRAAGGPAE